MSDLWPEDIAKVTMVAPVTMLREQAAKLSEKTKHLVEAEVEAIERSNYLKKNEFGYTFDIVTSFLGGYRYRLFSIYYGISMYPLRIDIEEEMKKDVTAKVTDHKEAEDLGLIKVESEKEFLNVLKEILASKKTRQVIQAILSQSGAKLE